MGATGERPPPGDAEEAAALEGWISVVRGEDGLVAVRDEEPGKDAAVEAAAAASPLPTQPPPPPPPPLPPRPETTYKLYRQFVLDVPRVDVFINAERWSGHPALLFMDLWNCFETKARAAKALGLFSQSELAPWFAKGRDMWVCSDTAHLLDGGRQQIHVSISSSGGFFRTRRRITSLTLSKPFRVVDLVKGGLECQERFMVVLSVTHNLVNDEVMHDWTRQENSWTCIEAAGPPPAHSPPSVAAAPQP